MSNLVSTNSTLAAQQCLDRFATDWDRASRDLLWYQGLTQAEASELLGIPLRTLGRSWKMARVKLAETLIPEGRGNSDMPSHGKNLK